MTIRIRAYADCDREFVSHCLVKMWDHDVQIDSSKLGVRTPGTERMYSSGMLRRYRTHHAFIPIAELDVVPAGFVAAWVSKVGKLEQLIQRPHRRGHISELCALKAFRRKGAGSRLLEAPEKRLKRDGCEIVGLDVSVDNTGAGTLYRGAGYVPRSHYMFKRVGKPRVPDRAARYEP
jgi:ribosomal protein S18 acetylase RimI-like enzyme